MEHPTNVMMLEMRLASDLVAINTIRLLFSHVHLIIFVFPAIFVEPQESELNRILLLFRQRNICELNANRCSV